MLIRREISDAKLLAAKYRRMMRESAAAFLATYDYAKAFERDFFSKPQRSQKIGSELRIKLPTTWRL